MVEKMLAVRSAEITHEAIRQWEEKFNREFAAASHRRSTHRADKWHLDEVVVLIAGKKYWLSRQVEIDRRGRRMARQSQQASHQGRPALHNR
jgi:putative transposase